MWMLPVAGSDSKCRANRSSCPRYFSNSLFCRSSLVIINGKRVTRALYRQDTAGPLADETGRRQLLNYAEVNGLQPGELHQRDQEFEPFMRDRFEMTGAFPLPSASDTRSSE